MIVSRNLPTATIQQRPALSFVVVGDSGNYKEFVDAIRALAMIKRFGDRLTLIGYGHNRFRLEKWTRPLNVDHLVVFGHQIAHEDQSYHGYDVAIFVSKMADRIGPRLCALDKTVKAIAFGCNPTTTSLLARGRFRAMIAPGDRLALSIAMILAKPESDCNAPIDRS